MIKTRIEFTDKSKEIISRTAVMTDVMMANMAVEMEVQLKTSGRIPFKTGTLRSHARHMKIAANHYEVTDDAVYAAAQEAGITHGHPMRNYTTAGTGKGFFQAAIDNVKERGDEFAHIALRAAGLRDV